MVNLSLTRALLIKFAEKYCELFCLITIAVICCFVSYLFVDDLEFRSVLSIFYRNTGRPQGTSTSDDLRHKDIIRYQPSQTVNLAVGVRSCPKNIMLYFLCFHEPMELIWYIPR